jgi:hypothetical protein
MRTREQTDGDGDRADGPDEDDALEALDRQEHCDDKSNGIISIKLILDSTDVYYTQKGALLIKPTIIQSVR